MFLRVGSRRRKRKFRGDGMKILVIGLDGSPLSWCLRCQRDGHDVRLFIAPHKNNVNIGKGLVQLVDNWREWMRWADLVFLSDNSKYLYEIDSWRKDEGIKVCGATLESAAWELDRDKGQEILKKCGVPIIESKSFSNYDEAIEYVKKEGKEFVSKPSGDADKSLSYVSKSPADMVYMLQRWKKSVKKNATPFILQEKIKGIEFAVGSWFGPGGFNAGWCENFEGKKLMVGDLGPNTGEMHTTLRYVMHSKLADEVLKPIEKELMKTGHTGYVDVNCMITDDGKVYPLEFTMRPGWPCYHLQQELHEGDAAQWMLDLVEGNDAENFILDTVATGAVMAIPDFPYSHITRKEVTSIPLYGLKKSMESHVHPCEMMLGKAPHNTPSGVVDKECLVTCGDYVLVVTQTGDTVSSSAKAVYKILDKLEMPNSPFWRVDAGRRLKKQLPILQAHGYAEDLVY